MKRPEDWQALRRRDRIEAPDDGRKYGSLFGLVHPQWGGYCFPCVVEFRTDNSHRGGYEGRTDLPCFEVYEFHDGEFPTEHLENTRHYCCPQQVLRFGLDVIELMVQHCESPTTPSVEWLGETINRLEDLLEHATNIQQENDGK